MNARKVIVLATVLLSGCVQTASIPRPSQPSAAGIGIEVLVRAPISVFSRSPDQIYFIKVDDPEGPFQDRVIPSSYSSDGRVYLLNIEPGRYAAVAAVAIGAAGQSVEKGPYTRFVSLFSADLVAQTEVSVTPGQLTFMGRYVVDQSGCKGADSLQAHYGNVVGSAMAMRYVCYRGSVQKAERDDRARREFLSRAKEDLREGGWASVIQQQLSQ